VTEAPEPHCPACGLALLEGVIRCARCGAPFAGSAAVKPLRARVDFAAPLPSLDDQGEIDAGGPRLSFSIDPDEPE
jgi:hypothetical protein